MIKKLLVTSVSVVALFGGVVTATAQNRDMMDEPQAGNQTQPGGFFFGMPGGMGMGFGQGQGVAGFGMMGEGMMGQGMMHLFLILMDADGDGALSLDEYQEGHARIFHYLDANGDGRLTSEELETHMHSEMDGS